ncbi:TPA: hypothetical protein ACOEQU_000129 [Stenotrophomonas maltophilia]
MSSKHTPGPWVVTPHPMTNVDVFAVGVIMDDKEMQYGLSHTICYENAEANARLIAAAPELLEALTKKVQDAEQRMFEDWLEFKSPSGDHEAVQRQWLESNDYRGFIGEWREQLDAIANATGDTQ